MSRHEEKYHDLTDAILAKILTKQQNTISLSLSLFLDLSLNICFCLFLSLSLYIYISNLLSFAFPISLTRLFVSFFFSSITDSLSPLMCLFTYILLFVCVFQLLSLTLSLSIYLSIYIYISISLLLLFFALSFSFFISGRSLSLSHCVLHVVFSFSFLPSFPFLCLPANQ